MQYPSQFDIRNLEGLALYQDEQSHVHDRGVTEKELPSRHRRRAERKSCLYLARGIEEFESLKLLGEYETKTPRTRQYSPSW